MTTSYGERPGLTVDGGAVNADGVDMSGFMAVLHDAGADECGNVTVSSGLWSRIKCEHYTALAEAARLRAALRRSYDAMTAGANGCHKPARDAMLSDAILEAGAALRATEAGKDGAK